jgi:hypothetical protein
MTTSSFGDLSPLRSHRDSRAGEKLDKIVHRTGRFGNFALRGLDPRIVTHHVLDIGTIAAGCEERDIELSQEFRNEAPRKSICAV